MSESCVLVIKKLAFRNANANQKSQKIPSQRGTAQTDRPEAKMEAKIPLTKAVPLEVVFAVAFTLAVIWIPFLLKKTPCPKSGKTGCGEPRHLSRELYHELWQLSTDAGVQKK